MFSLQLSSHIKHYQLALHASSLRSIRLFHVVVYSLVFVSLVCVWLLVCFYSLELLSFWHTIICMLLFKRPTT